MKKLILIFSVLLPFICAAQNEVDALRYSQNLFGGTARYHAMSGAFGALGGDFSSLSTNPAGLGVYRSSEFMFTPQFSYNTSSTTYMNGTLDDYKFRMNFSNVGFVATHVSGREEGWVTTSFAAGYNRLADFNHFIKIEGQNNSSSMTDYFAKLAKGSKFNSNDNLYDNEEMGAWWCYLINPANIDSTSYKSSLVNYGETQTKDINTKGGMGEYVISLAGNYSNKLYIGGTLGIQSVRYVENSFYATKVAFCNELYDLCETIGIPYNRIRELWLLDPRMNKSFTSVFPDNRGFGGKCFPKDIKAFLKYSKKSNNELSILKAVIDSNETIRNKKYE